MSLKEPKSVQMGWYLAELVLMGIGSVHIHCQFCNQLPEGTELPSILIFRDHESWKRRVKIVKIALKTFFGGLWMTMTRPFCFVTLWSASKVLADFAHKNIWQLWTFFKCQKLFLNLHNRSTFGFLWLYTVKMVLCCDKMLKKLSCLFDVLKMAVSYLAELPSRLSLYM